MTSTVDAAAGPTVDPSNVELALAVGEITGAGKRGGSTAGSAANSPSKMSQKSDIQGAYADRDGDASRDLHTATLADRSFAAERHAAHSGEFVKSLVFGGIDGIITTFSIIAASYGAVSPYIKIKR